MRFFCSVLSFLISIACCCSLDDRIAGGDLAMEGQFPYMVALLRYGKFACGGAIINKQWIITAAHCIKSYPAEAISLTAGTTKRTARGIIYESELAIKHERWNGDLYINDIALIKLTKEINFTDKIKPIALNPDYIPAGSELILSGWGRVEEDQHSSEDLHFVRLMTISQEQCQKKHQHKVTDTMMCTFTKIGEGSCKGDSGSPLVVDGKVAGISSWGKHCGGSYPNVYTRVASFIDWVQQTIAEN